MDLKNRKQLAGGILYLKHLESIIPSQIHQDSGIY